MIERINFNRWLKPTAMFKTFDRKYFQILPLASANGQKSQFFI
jgi:hypothetical protein